MSFDRLSPLDASFLAVETPTAHMHVGWATAFEPPEGRARPSFDELRRHIELRLGRSPRYRQMLRRLPLGIGAPAWIDDPRFDIDRHVYRAASGSLGEIVDECMSRPLARDRPLWQLYVADRLDDGRVGVVGKAHHCMVDGLAAVELAALLLDAEPDAPDPDDADWAPSPRPRDRDLLASAASDFARDQARLVRKSAEVLGSPRKARSVLGRGARAASSLLDAMRPAAPQAHLNPPISPRRHLGMVRRPIADLVRIKEAFDVKLNDVVLAAAAGGVRGYLARQGAFPPQLKTMVPVSLRDPSGASELGNAISFMFIDLPCDEPRADRRLRVIHAATAARKRAGKAAGGGDVIRSLALAPQPLRAAVSRLLATPQAFNLVVSNIPGPRGRLFMRGCPLVEAYPVVPIADRHALAIGITTVADSACFGLYADRESLPDVDVLAESVDAAIDELLELTPRARPTTDRVMVPAG